MTPVILLSMITRRDLLRTAAAGAAALAGRAQSPESHIEILTAEPIGRIAPEIYSHFVEHLGGVVYDGIWVGENSTIPNTNGIRKALTDALARSRPGAIRWPGGCYADQYDWRDGIGPRAQRPRRTNFWVDSPEWPKDARRDGPQSYEPNQMGTVEFARFCRLSGAQPYFAANLRSLPAQEFWRWVEYCNSPAGATTLAGQRAADGESAPLNVRYWGVGNESWGCGGNFTPEDYATEYRRFTAWTPGYGQRLQFVASGPSAGELSWTRGFFSKVGPALNNTWGFALHHYSWNASAGRTTDWYAGKRDAVRFDAEQYYEILHEANLMESLITSHWGVMGEYDRRHRVKLVVDEWGAWYAPGTEPFPEALLGQQSTMRDAVLSGLTLDTFQRHADKVGMANAAQLVNCLHSLFLAHEDKFCLTPAYHVFAMYGAHQNATSLRTLISAPQVTYSRNGSPATLPGLAGSASIDGKRVLLTVTNQSLDTAWDAEVVVRGAAIQSATVTTLAASDVHAHNTFENPNTVEPKMASASPRSGILQHRFPPASVTKIEFLVG